MRKNVWIVKKVLITFLYFYPTAETKEVRTARCELRIQRKKWIVRYKLGMWEKKNLYLGILPFFLELWETKCLRKLWDKSHNSEKKWYEIWTNNSEKKKVYISQLSLFFWALQEKVLHDIKSHLPFLVPFTSILLCYILHTRFFFFFMKTLFDEQTKIKVAFLWLDHYIWMNHSNCEKDWAQKNHSFTSWTFLNSL